MSESTATGYGPSRYARLNFNGDESLFELWETRFMGYLALKDLSDVVTGTDDATVDV